MKPQITNIHQTAWHNQSNDRGESWSMLDLSGEHLGVRLEELSPGDCGARTRDHENWREAVLSSSR